MKQALFFKFFTKGKILVSCILFLTQLTTAQVIQLPDCLDCPTAGTGSIVGQGTICKELTYSAVDLQVSAAGDGVAILSIDTSLFIINEYNHSDIGLAAIKALEYRDFLPCDSEFELDRYNMIYPTEIVTPYNNSVKFVDVIYYNNLQSTIIANTASGETWGYLEIFNSAGSAPLEEHYCHNCPGASTESDAIDLTTIPNGNCGAKTVGWFRITTPEGQNIVDVAFHNSNGGIVVHWLDTQGQVWVSSNSNSTLVSANSLGLGGASYNPFNGSPTFKKLTIPNGDNIIEIEARQIANQSSNLYMLGASGNIYAIGDQFVSSATFSSNTPIQIPMPAGVQAVEMKATQYSFSGMFNSVASPANLFVEGSDGKLYGKGIDDHNIISLSGNPTTNYLDLTECDSWTAIGTGVQDFFPLANGDVFVVGDNNLLYLNYETVNLTMTAGNWGTTLAGPGFTLYDGQPNANLDYSMGIKHIVAYMANGSGNPGDERAMRPVLINTTTYLAKSAVIYQDFVESSTKGVLHTEYPFNFNYIETCLPIHPTGNIINLDNGDSHPYLLNTETISGPGN